MLVTLRAITASKDMNACRCGKFARPARNFLRHAIFVCLRLWREVQAAVSDIGIIPATSEITPERVYLQRREFIKSSLLFAATSSGVGSTLLWLMRGLRAKDHKKGADTVTPDDQRALTVAQHFDYASGEENTSYNAVTNYNNFYEFGTDKSDPAANAGTLRPHQWQLTIEGEVARPRVFEIEELIKSFSLEERVYRMRCVEAWSMVIPWVGFPLGD